MKEIIKDTGFKSAVTKSGLCMAAIFCCRIICDVLSILLSKLGSTVGGPIDDSILNPLITVANVLVLYGGGIFLCALIMGVSLGDIFPMYKNTGRLGKAVSWAVPSYGASQVVSLTVIAISFLVAGNKNAVSDTFSPITSGGNEGTTVVKALLLVFQLSVLAPVLEEFWFRGIIQTGLEKYGNGFAILVSALLFGIAHGNVHQFSYATVMGILVGYVRYASKSLLATTIIHSIINSIAAILLVILSSEPVVSGMTKMQEGIELTGDERGMIAFMMIYTLVVLIFIIISVVSAVNKVKNFRLYRPVANYTELTAKQKLTSTISNPIFIISLVFCIAYMVLQIFF